MVRTNPPRRPRHRRQPNHHYRQTVHNSVTTTLLDLTHAYDTDTTRLAKIVSASTDGALSRLYDDPTITLYPNSSVAIDIDYDQSMGGRPNSYTTSVSGPSGTALVAKAVIPNPNSCPVQDYLACYAVTITTPHLDHLGSTSVVTNSSGTMQELIDYTPYGSERLSWSATSESGESDSLKTFIGEYSDRESGLSYLNARYYDAGRGGFVSQDSVFVNVGTGDKDIMASYGRNQIHKGIVKSPNSVSNSTDNNLLRLRELLADPQMQNSYSYGRNSPITMVDPSGNFALQFGLSGNVGLGAEVGVSLNTGFASDGTFGLSASVHGGGLAGADASVGLSVGYSRAESWNDTIGGGEYVSVGGKVLLGGSVTTNFSDGEYAGTDIGVGIGARLGPTPIPITFSGGLNETYSVIQGNISSVVQSVRNSVSSAISSVSRGIGKLFGN